MNTTSMEYVICQEKTNKAPLILSEFMGISTTMRDALYVVFQPSACRLPRDLLTFNDHGSQTN